MAEERRGGEERRGRGWRAGAQLAGTEASPIWISQAVSSACSLTFLLRASRWAGPAAGPGFPCSLGAALLEGPAGVGTVTVAKCANFVPLSLGQGEPWRLATDTGKCLLDGNSMGFVHLFSIMTDSI